MLRPVQLLELFDLTASGADTWQAPSWGPPDKRLYGGQVMAQALAAAGRTVPDGQAARDLHAHFIRAGDAAAPVRFRVERLHDGRSASTRRVLAEQGERLLLSATASFSGTADGPEHAPGRATVTGPDEATVRGPRYPAPGLADDLEIRYVDGAGSGDRMWFRATTPLPAEPLLHACAAVYAMDLYLVDVALRVHGLRADDRTTQWASTSHSVWFQRPVRADEWLLLDSGSPSAAGGRGLVRGDLYPEAGALVAAFVQEVMLRYRRAQR